LEDVRVDLAGVDDAPVVHRIMQESFAEYAGRLQPPTGSLAETVEDVAAFLRRGGAVIAWLGSTPVGAARFEQTDDWLYVGRVSVLPAYRRRGLARAMMRYIEDMAASQGLSSIQVGVRMSLPSNLALYRELGYELTEIRPHPKGPDRIGWLKKPLR
jgi:ribosomal protein S18 acetylase RimI-like enzyme